MKTVIISLIILFTVSCSVQKRTVEHLPDSQSLVGIWRQVVYVKKKDTGEIKKIYTGNYKVINTDGTFYCFVIWGNKIPDSSMMDISLYGTYDITSDSTYTEHIIRHKAKPLMSNTKSELRYKMMPNSSNNVVEVSFKNEHLGKWIPELWERVSATHKATHFKL